MAKSKSFFFQNWHVSKFTFERSNSMVNGNAAIVKGSSKRDVGSVQERKTAKCSITESRALSTRKRKQKERLKI